MVRGGWNKETVREGSTEFEGHSRGRTLIIEAHPSSVSNAAPPPSMMTSH